MTQGHGLMQQGRVEISSDKDPIRPSGLKSDKVKNKTNSPKVAEYQQ